MPAKQLSAHKTTRREVLTFVSALLAMPSLARANPGKRLPQVGFLVLNLPLAEYRSGARGGWAIIKPELRRLGWNDGHNVVFHVRSAEGDWTRIPALISDLLSIPVDLLVTYGPAVGEAAKQTSVIPIVGPLTWQRDSKLPANVTGINDVPSSSLYPKHLSLLKTMAPSISRVAIAYDARMWGLGSSALQGADAAAAALGVTLMSAPVRSFLRPESDLDAAAERGAQGMIVISTPGTQFPENQLPVHAWARKRRIPVIYETPNAANTGGLMAFGIESNDLHRRLTYFVDKILRGAKASELPVEDPTRYEFVINLRAAAAIGLTVPVALQIEATSIVDP